jgi:DNA polymerase III subunit beta
MKLETTAGMLKAALDAVKPAIETRNTIPILGMVKFDGRTVEATNLDMTIVVTLPARTARGALCVPFRPLAALISQVGQNEVVTIEGDEKKAVISFGMSRYDLPALGTGDFPSLDLGQMPVIKVDGDGLKRALGFVAPSVSTEETRYYLNGVYFDGDLAVATDGHRLAAHPMGFSVGDAKGIIPRPAIRVMLAMPPATNMLIDPVKLRFIVNAPGISLSGKLIDGTYPDWRRVVPKLPVDAPEMHAEREPLRRMLARLGAISWQRQAVAIAWSGDTIAAVVKDPDGVIGREQMSTIPHLNGGRFGVNLSYFSAALRLLQQERIVLRVDPHGGPMVMEGPNGAFMLVMPMRLSRDEETLAAEMLTEAARRRLTEVAA